MRFTDQIFKPGYGSKYILKPGSGSALISKTGPGPGSDQNTIAQNSESKILAGYTKKEGKKSFFFVTIITISLKTKEIK